MLISIVVWILAFVVAITVHEAAHAFMSDRLGDPTARLKGRLSLNPLVHYDPIGTTLLLVTVILRAMGVPVIPFGWAKPVGFDPYNLKEPIKDAALISLSGPGANLLLAIILALIIRFVPTSFSPLNFIVNVFYPFIILNLSLAVFNLIPIHPLDGGKILIALVPKNKAREVDEFLNRYGLILLFFLIFPSFGGNSLLSLIVSPVVEFFLKILLPGTLLF